MARFLPALRSCLRAHPLRAFALALGLTLYLLRPATLFADVGLTPAAAAQPGAVEDAALAASAAGSAAPGKAAPAAGLVDKKVEESPLRRFETISIGSFPIILFYSNFGFDLARFIVNDFNQSYAPWPFSGTATATMKDEERLARLWCGTVLSFGLGGIDSAIRSGTFELETRTLYYWANNSGSGFVFEPGLRVPIGADKSLSAFFSLGFPFDLSGSIYLLSGGPTMLFPISLSIGADYRFDFGTWTVDPFAELGIVGFFAWKDSSTSSSTGSASWPAAVFSHLDSSIGVRTTLRAGPRLKITSGLALDVDPGLGGYPSYLGLLVELGARLELKQAR